MEVFCTRACKVVSPEVSQAPRVEMPAARLAGELLDAPVASALEVDGRVVSRQRAGSQGVRERESPLQRLFFLSRRQGSPKARGSGCFHSFSPRAHLTS